MAPSAVCALVGRSLCRHARAASLHVGFLFLGRLARAGAKLHLTNRVIDGKLTLSRASKEIERLYGVQPMSLRDKRAQSVRIRSRP
jgi:hypothetical protein